MSQRNGCLGGVFFLYLTLAALAYAIALSDQNAGSTALYKGYVGSIALGIAGLPWSLMLVDTSMGLSEKVASMLLYLFPALNLLITGWIAFASGGQSADQE